MNISPSWKNCQKSEEQLKLTILPVLSLSVCEDCISEIQPIKQVKIYSPLIVYSGAVLTGTLLECVY